MKNRKVLNKQTNKQTNKPNTLIEYKAKRTVRLLINHIAAIPNVICWAEKAGVSREWLCKSMKEIYDKPPKIIIREVKYEKVVRLIQEEGIDAGCYSVAVDSGFRNAGALSKFLSTFYETNYTNLKLEIMNGELRFASTWLNGIHE